jgi:hypothetical protein
MEIIGQTVAPIRPALNSAPSIALTKNTLEGEKRSAIAIMQKTKVPKINPNCTAEVRLPIAVAVRPKLITKSVITALLANQREVQQN